MADRFPLIVDSSAEQLQELAVGDNLNLASSGLINADNIQTSGLNVGVMTATSFIGDGSQLTNLPAAGSSTELTASGTLADGSKVIVNADGTVSAVAQIGSGWIATLGGTSSDYGRGISVDSSGNVYVSGYTGSSGAGANDVLIAKYNSSGTIQWQRTLGGSSNDEGYGIAVDSSGNVYVGGFTSSQGPNNYNVLVVKYDTSGTIQWQRVLGGHNVDAILGNGIAVDSSGNVYITGKTASTTNGTPIAGSTDVLIAKYNTSGTLQWQRILGGTSADDGYGIGLDSSGNVYITAPVFSSGAGSEDLLIAKYNNSGALQWQRTLGTTSSDYGYGIAVDSSGNSYISGFTSSSGAGSNDFLIVKYDTSGAIQWQRTIGDINSDQSWSSGVDSSGNVYVTGYTNSGAGALDFLIVKYNSSGTIQWQRTFGGTGNDLGYGIAVDNSGNLYVTGRTESSGAGNTDLIIAKLPTDGSGTGTFGAFTYASSSLTDSVSTLTDAAGTLTSSTSLLSDQATTLTDSSSSLASSTISMISTNLTSENFIGISDGSYSNGQTATVQLIGSVDDAQSSLTPGQQYYVQGDGTLSETADSPSVLAGTAIAATKLLIKK